MTSIPSKEDRALLPCPFCGGAVAMTQKGENQLTIKCGCGVTRTQKVLRHPIEWLRSKMTENWNTRSPAVEARREREALEEKFTGLKFLIQYRLKDDGVRWHNMAAFDGALAAEGYFKQQCSDEYWPWEYQLVDLEEGTTTRQEQARAAPQPSSGSDGNFDFPIISDHASRSDGK